MISYRISSVLVTHPSIWMSLIFRMLLRILFMPLFLLYSLSFRTSYFQVLSLCRCFSFSPTPLSQSSPWLSFPWDLPSSLPPCLTLLCLDQIIPVPLKLGSSALVRLVSSVLVGLCSSAVVGLFGSALGWIGWLSSISVGYRSFGRVGYPSFGQVRLVIPVLGLIIIA